MAKSRAVDRKEWRSLPFDEWRTPTVHAMIIDLNVEKFGVTKYIPLRGWAFEQGVIKRALAEYGAAAVRETIERAFAEYRPNEKYPQLTAGFLVTYILPRIMPQVLAEEEARRRRQESENDAPDVDDVIAWLRGSA